MNRRRLKAHDYDDGDDPTENSFHDQRRKLSRNINAIRVSQRLYMTGIGHLLDEINPVLLADRPEIVPLWFPSDLLLSTRGEWCVADLPRLEYRLRYAMAVNALHEVRRFRRFAQAATAKTQSHISNTQKTGTRANGQLDRIQQRVTRAANTYRACWSAIQRLAPDEEFGPWKNTLRELRREDVRGPGREKDETSQSRHVPSWIWQTLLPGPVPGNDQDLYSALRVEWCKAQERATRYEEEVQLVAEEMRRTLVFFEWLACQWEDRATTPSMSGPGVEGAVVAGTSAYAHKQAVVYSKMVDVFVNDWYGHLKTKSLGSSWLQCYRSPSATKRRRLPSNVRLYHSTPGQSDTDLPAYHEPSDYERESGTEYDGNNAASADIDLLEELLDA